MCVCVYIYFTICAYVVKYYSAIKKEFLPFVTTWMELEGIMLSDVSQTEKDKCKYYMIACMCRIRKQN